MTLRKTICNISYDHLKSGYQLYGQCLTAAGFVANTVPDVTEEDGLVELPMSDVANGGFVVGAGLANKRPIYVIRYQGFGWYNLISILNYACKSKDMWGVSCPIFVRAIAMEGGIGPVAGSSHHSLAYRMPGIRVVSPMTPNEYITCYEDFMRGDSPVFVSEHRGSYDNSEEMENEIHSGAVITLYPISITRFACVKASRELAKDGIKVNIIHQVNLGEDHLTGPSLVSLENTRVGLVLDDDYPDGISANLACDLMRETGWEVGNVGLPQRTAGFSKETDVLPPSAGDIINMVKTILEKA